MLWALATLGMEPGTELATAILRRALALAGDFEQQHVSNVMWALATLGMQPGAELATAMSKRAAVMASEFGQQALASLMWALAVLGSHGGWQTEWSTIIFQFALALSAHYRTSADSAKVSTFDASGLRQLHQVIVCASLDGLWPGIDLAGLLGPDMVGLCRRVFEDSPTSRSNMQARP